MNTRATALAAGALLIGGLGAVSVLVALVSDDDQDAANGQGAYDARQVPAQYRGWVARAGEVCETITSPLIAAQIKAESNWNPTAQSRDPRTGAVIAQGIAQFIPSTWSTWGVDASDKAGEPHPDGVADPFEPGDAIMTQARYDCHLATLVRSYHLKGDPIDLTLAAYNAGPGAVKSFGGIPPYPETQTYVARIRRYMADYQRAGTDEASGPFPARVVASAKKWLGTPYAWGGGTVHGPSVGFDQGGGTRGFDCSSLVRYAVYQASGGKLTIPRVSEQQVNAGKAVAPKDLQVGDVIGFALHGGGDYDHIGIYVGGGKFIHAPHTGDVVKITSLHDPSSAGGPSYADVPQRIRRFG